MLGAVPRAMLSEFDVRRMVRLLGEVAALEGDHMAKKRYLLSGLSELIQARAWLWSLVTDMDPGQLPVHLSSLHGGFTDGQFALFLRALDHPDLAHFSAPFFAELQRRQAHTSRMRQQSDPEYRFAFSGAYPLWQAAGVVPGIMSARPIGPRSLSTIGIFRSPEDPPFSARDLRIAHIILSEVPWLHEQGWPEDRAVTIPRLSLRQRQTLNLLIEGQSRKQIADGMGISLHTLGGYIKEVYRHFRVRSQAELMRRFLRGDGGDQA